MWQDKSFRRDEIDSTHYPVFHQLEGVFYDATYSINECESSLKSTCEELVKHLFGESVTFRWQRTVFPYTDPSLEIEVLHNDKWVEIMGCGVLKKSIWSSESRSRGNAWAFGPGLERLAMILYGIPDIRYLWSSSSAILDQFDYDTMNQFKPVHAEKPKSRDISFWINTNGFDSNHLFEI